MYSRIFQIEVFPVGEDYRITVDNYIGDHWFVYSIANYVMEDENRDRSLECLKVALAPGTGFIDYFADDNGEGFILREGFRAAYFSSAYASFQQCLQDLMAATTPEAYASGTLASEMLTLTAAYDDEFGPYVDCDETGLVTINSFLRYAKIDTRYYFGGTVCYHH